MIPITINNCPFFLPQKWSEVTMKQYIEMNVYKDDLNPCRLLSIFTGISYDDLQTTNADGVTNNILELLGDFNDDVDFSTIPAPASIELGGKQVKVPQDIKTETFGQKVLMHEKLNGVIKDQGSMINLFSEIAAVYLQPHYHGELFNDKKVDEVKAILDQKPVTEVYPIANFFLTNYIQSSRMN